MTEIVVGTKVNLIENAKRYHGGLARVADINRSPGCAKPYLLERKFPAGQGKRFFWAARGEFTIAEEGEES